MTRQHPRRIVPPSPPGALLKRFDSQPPTPHKKDAGREKDYLAEIRQLPCLKCGVEPCGEAAHVRFASAAFGKSSGMNKTPDDRWALPVCRSDHLLAKDAQHKQSELSFWSAIGINPLLAAVRLYEKRGDLVAMRALAISIIGERG